MTYTVTLVNDGQRVHQNTYLNAKLKYETFRARAFQQKELFGIKRGKRVQAILEMLLKCHLKSSKLISLKSLGDKLESEEFMHSEAGSGTSLFSL